MLRPALRETFCQCLAAKGIFGEEKWAIEPIVMDRLFGPSFWGFGHSIFFLRIRRSGRVALRSDTRCMSAVVSLVEKSPERDRNHPRARLIVSVERFLPVLLSTFTIFYLSQEKLCVCSR
jgi:hypothetical protein